MRPLSIGKLRGLQQCATPRGTLSILALDHRQNLQKAFAAERGQPASYADLVTFKQTVVRALAPAASAVLLDPEFGAGQAVVSGALPGDRGLITALDATGYTDDAGARRSQLLTGWNAQKTRHLGANAAKLLVYYHPAAPNHGAVEAFVREVATECQREDLLLILEPLSYSLDPQRKLTSDEKHEIVIESARRLIVPGVDILKAEFPLDTAAQPDEQVWQAACQALSDVSPIPWILLSASVDFETYVRQVTAACRGGASGIAAGRAVWREALALGDDARADFLSQTAVPRIAQLTEICNGLARPWQRYFAVPELAEMWYETYGNHP